MVSISTTAVEARHRQAYWTDLVCAHLVHADCAGITDPSNFHGHIHQWSADDAGVGASVSHIRSAAQRVRHGTAHIAQASDEHVLVNIQRKGVGHVRQDGREAVLLPGDLAVYTSDRPYELAFDAAFEQTVLILPTDLVQACAPDFRRHTAARVPADRLGVSVLTLAAREFANCDALPQRADMVQAMVSLLSVCMGGNTTGRGRPRTGPRRDQPSLREHQVLDLLSRGFAHEDIARHMAVSLTTVRSHVRNLYAKLGAHNKTEAVFEARQAGWLD